MPCADGRAGQAGAGQLGQAAGRRSLEVVRQWMSMWSADAGLTRVGGFRFATATGRALRGPDETEWTGDGRQG